MSGKLITAALILVLAIVSSSLGAARAQRPDSDPYVSTPRYNKFPWAFTADYAFVFSVSPAWKQPVNPGSWFEKPILPGELHAAGPTPFCSLYCHTTSLENVS
jgi:hypothetical protein